VAQGRGAGREHRLAPVSTGSGCVARVSGRVSGEWGQPRTAGRRAHAHGPRRKRSPTLERRPATGSVSVARPSWLRDGHCMCRAAGPTRSERLPASSARKHRALRGRGAAPAYVPVPRGAGWQLRPARLRQTRGGGTRAASFSRKVSGSKTTRVVPPRDLPRRAGTGRRAAVADRAGALDVPTPSRAPLLGSAGPIPLVRAAAPGLRHRRAALPPLRGGRRRLIAQLTHPGPITAILSALGLPTEAPLVHPARGPPELFGEGL